MNLVTRELTLESNGDDVRVLHRQLVELGLAIPDGERRGATFGKGTQTAVLRFQEERQLERTGELDTITAAALQEALDSGVYTVTGMVTSPDRVGVRGLRVRLVDKRVGQDVAMAEAVTDERGRYEVRFTGLSLPKSCKTSPDPQAQVYAGNVFLAASEVRYNASKQETLNVALPANCLALPSEHETLTNALAAACAGKLSALQESPERQDITYLANKTGWDARAVALATLAEQFSLRDMGKDGTPSIPAPLYYALFRAGLPADPTTLYRATAATARAIWKQAMAQGIIPTVPDDNLAAAAQAVQSLGASHALDAPLSSGTSTLREMLRLALGDDVKRQEHFAELYTAYHDDLPAFWNQVRQSFDDAPTSRLQLDGQLGSLTFNNAPLIGRLHFAAGETPLSSTLDLAQRGFYRADKWTPLLESVVPSVIPGNTPAEQTANYAELLAAQVRLAHPTAAVAEMVRRDEVPLGVAPDIRDGVHAFLTAHQGQFELGMHPIEQYLSTNNLSSQVSAPVKDQIKRLQRVYQISPSHEAMAALLRNKVDSAQGAMRYSEPEFIAAFKDQVGGEADARLIHAKAAQVHTTVVNIAMSYLAARSAPRLGSDANTSIIDAAPVATTARSARSDDAGEQATLERLFGPMDYCACEQCRSILSPAAYLVDLLFFLDSPATGADTPAPGQPSPLSVLLARRPDLQALPLTCENTNTVLPYIDVVNETLEYFVAHRLSLADYSGHDTDATAISSELLASPQFVDETAYESLRTAFFPPPLPFHRSLETLRRYFATIGVPLHEAMEVLRRSDALDETPYGWSDILIERLGFSRTEYRLLTDSALPLNAVFGYARGRPQQQVLRDLSNVKAFSERVAITYEDIVELLKTRLVNPDVALIRRVERLGVPLTTLEALKKGRLHDADFVELLPPGLDWNAYRVNDVHVKGPAAVVAWVKANYDRIVGLIVIAATDGATLCTMEALEFRHADPSAQNGGLMPVEFLRMLRLVRISRKLGWTLEQTDKTITALGPASPHGDRKQLDKAFRVLLPRLGVLLQVMERMNLQADTDLLGLLACWESIDTDGDGSLYRAMFLTPTLLKQDSVFADSDNGVFLPDVPGTHPTGLPAPKLLKHTEALRAAFNLTSDELALILADRQYDESTPLTLTNLSDVYRRGWLARKLGLSVCEFLLLTRVTGIDPFAPPDPPRPPILALLDLLDALRRASLTPSQALYLVWNQDISGTAAPSDLQIAELARTLRAGLGQVDAEFTIAGDPSTELLRSRMTSVYGAYTADFFVSLVDGSFSVQTGYAQAAGPLDAGIVQITDKIAYDATRQQLSYTGVLSEPTRDALKRAGVTVPNFPAAMDALYAATWDVIDPVFEQYPDPDLRAWFDQYVASTTPPAPQDAIDEARQTLWGELLRALRAERKNEAALAVSAAAARADPSFARAILTDSAVLHAAQDRARAAIDEFTAVETRGLSAEFFWRRLQGGAARPSPDLSSDAEAGPLYSADGVRLPRNASAGAVISGIWSGYLEAPDTGDYSMEIDTDAEVVELTVDAKSLGFAQDGIVWKSADPVRLTAGSLVAVTLTITGVTKALAVRWRTQRRGWEVIPAVYLYSATLVERLRAAHIRFLKIVALAGAAKLTASETAWFASHPDYRLPVPGSAGEKVGWVNALAVSSDPGVPASQIPAETLRDFLDLGRLKASFAPNDERLLDVLKELLFSFLHPVTTRPGGDAPLLSLTGWDGDSLKTLRDHFGATDPPDLANIGTFRRFYDAFSLLKRFGISASRLIAATTNDPEAGSDGAALTTISSFESALRARYDSAAWLAVIKPINDDLRALRRDALVAYILQGFREHPDAPGGAPERPIDTPDKLFEYFLLDVQMDPCMETSRIRLALSSVQLFIDRCLMNLEPPVLPSSINADQWAWMKRYRVWEANRKVFLWPENWLEPELRDDQSPFFKETMSQLLQSDLTEDNAAEALVGYLGKLEEVATLEPCGIHYVEGDSAADNTVVHVVARTTGASRKYYHRRLESGSWTPWEQIKLQIEDTPLMPAVLWNGRLVLFWLKIIMSAPKLAELLVDPVPTGDSDPSAPLSTLTQSELRKAARDGAATLQVNVQAILCWSEYYNGKWQPARTSDERNPTSILVISADQTFDRSGMTLAVAPLVDPRSAGNNSEVAPVRVSICLSDGFEASWFVFYRTHSPPVRREDVHADPWVDHGARRVLSDAPDPSALRTTFSIQYSKSNPAPRDGLGVLQSDVLTSPVAESAVQPQHPLADVWNAPFILWDNQHAFYVTTAEHIYALADVVSYGGSYQVPTAQITPIAPLVLNQDPPPAADFHDPLGHTPTFGTVDPVPIRRLMKHNRNIRSALRTSATINYMGMAIAPGGSSPSDRG